MAKLSLTTALHGNYYDGSSSMRAIKPIETPSLLEQQGYKRFNTADKYVEAINLYLNRSKLNIQISEREMWARAGL